MEVKYNVTGERRKELVKVISDITGAKAEYKRMPTCNYEIDIFTVTKDGTLIFSDRSNSEEVEQVLEGITAAGFELPEEPEPTEEAPDKREAITDLTITLPKESLTDDKLENLKSLIEAKGSLIKQALGVEDLPIETDDENISFPWFHGELGADEVTAYTDFIDKLAEMARNQQRVTAKAAEEIENPKYAFRCFLLRAGFIGAEYKTDRKILLRNLEGSSAFKSGSRKEDAE